MQLENIIYIISGIALGCFIEYFIMQKAITIPLIMELQKQNEILKALIKQQNKPKE